MMTTILLTLLFSVTPVQALVLAAAGTQDAEALGADTAALAVAAEEAEAEVPAADGRTAFNSARTVFLTHQ